MRVVVIPWKRLGRDMLAVLCPIEVTDFERVRTMQKTSGVYAVYLGLEPRRWRRWGWAVIQVSPSGFAGTKAFGWSFSRRAADRKAQEAMNVL